MVINEDEVRAELQGLEPFIDAMSMPFSTLFVQKIKQWEAYVQNKYGILLEPKIVRSGLNPEEPYDIIEEPYDFHWQHFRFLGYIRLTYRPITEVYSVKLRVRPIGQTLFPSPFVDIPKEWIRISPMMGTISIIPLLTGTLALPLAGIYFFPFLTQWGQFDIIPELIFIDYKAGFPDTNNPWPLEFETVKHLIIKRCALDILMSIKHTIAPDASSLSAGGVSRNFNRFRDRIEELQKQVEEIEKVIHERFTATPMAFI